MKVFLEKCGYFAYLFLFVILFFMGFVFLLMLIGFCALVFSFCFLSFLSYKFFRTISGNKKDALSRFLSRYGSLYTLYIKGNPNKNYPA
jgi:hypothetical protein